jgi:hypothetical protein
MRHPARGPVREAGIDGKSSAAGGRHPGVRFRGEIPEAAE